MKSQNILKVGILDFGKRDKIDSLTAIEELIAYACKADELDFSRFWLGEHHYSFREHPWTAPEIIINTIALMTEKIRVGSAGSLISLYSPYSIATQYKIMNALSNGRIDLGLAKGYAESPYTLKLLNINIPNGQNERERLGMLFHENMREICDLFNFEYEIWKEKGIVIPPYGGEIPQIWYLSKTYSNTKLAKENKINICRSLFHSNVEAELDPDLETLYHFRKDFKNSYGFSPEVIIAIAVCFEETIEKAKIKVSQLQDENSKNNQLQMRLIPATLDSIGSQLLEYKERYSVSEIVILDIATNSTEKIKNLLGIRESLTNTIKTTENV